MEQELVDLSHTMFNIYKRNLEFLESHFPDVYSKVEQLSEDISNGKYISTYSLEYINGYFDILNTETNSWFYGINSYEDADMRSFNTNFTKDGSIDLLRKGVDGKSLVGINSFKDVLPILDYINDNVDFDNIEFQKINKFIFIGTGLGFHMHEIFKKLQPLTTLIIEPELEVFRLSLFVINYSIFQDGNKKLFLSIEESTFDRKNTIEEFYKYHFYMNYNIKHHLLIQNYSYIHDELVNFFATNSVTHFPYSITIQNIHRTIDFIKQKNRFLSFELMNEKHFLKDKNILLIAAGPSLDNYIEYIANNQHKFIIICVDVIVKKLEKNGIIPDIVVSIDPSHLCAEFLTTENKNFLQNSAIVLLSQQDKSVLEVLQDKHYYFAQSVLLIPEIGFLGSTSNVGSFALLVAAHLGANKIFTIGNDAAFNQQDGNRYAKDNGIIIYDHTEDIDMGKNMISTLYQTIEVKGNIRDIVKTNRELLEFKYSFESTLHQLTQYYNDIKCYNLSDGVLINGFEPMNFEEFDKYTLNCQDKLSSKKLINEFDSVSIIINKPNIEQDLKTLNSMLTKLNKHKNIKIKTRNDFLEKKLDIMLWLLNQSKSMSSSLFGNIFLLYTELSDIYINFILNLKQKNIHNQKHLEHINSVWTNGVIAVLKDIKKALQ